MVVMVAIHAIMLEMQQQMGEQAQLQARPNYVQQASLQRAAALVLAARVSPTQLGRCVELTQGC